MKKGIRKIYSEVAGTYETVNHILTFGLDRRWRRKAARTAASAGGMHWLDVCSGTGEMAQNLIRRAPQDARITAVDGSLSMLAAAGRKPELKTAVLCVADVGSLPFPPGSFDLLTISFAARNLNPHAQGLTAYLTEFHRVLKPGGLFVNLETSQPRNPLVKRLFHLYVRWAVKPVGILFSGSRAGYSYLAYTLPRFYPAPELSGLMENAGFRQIEFSRLFLGVAAIHSGIKPRQRPQSSSADLSG